MALKNLNIKKILISSVVIWLVGSVFGILTCGWLFNWVYLIPPFIWKDPAVLMSTANMLGAYILGFITSVIFVTIFALLYKGLPEKGLKKGMTYGFIIWLVGAFSGIITMPFYMTIATTVVVYWILQALILNLINGAIIGKLYKP